MFGKLIWNVACVLFFLSCISGTQIHIYDSYEENEDKEINSMDDDFMKPNPTISFPSCTCKNGDCVTRNGKEECQCWPEYGKISPNACKKCNCGKESNCTIEVGWISDTINCICKPGYQVIKNTCVDSVPDWTPSLQPEVYSSSVPHSHSVEDWTPSLQPEASSLGEIRSHSKRDWTLQSDLISSHVPYSHSIRDSTHQPELHSSHLPYSHSIRDWTLQPELHSSHVPYSHSIRDWTQLPELYSTHLPYSHSVRDWTQQPELHSSHVPYSNSIRDWTLQPQLHSSHVPHSHSIRDWTQQPELHSSHVPYSHSIRDWTLQPELHSSHVPYSHSVSYRPPSPQPESFSSSEPLTQCDCGKKSLACKLDIHGNKICECKPGFSQLEDMCVDCYCGDNYISCSFDVNRNKKCFCEEGYAQRNRTCTKTCKFDYECMNGGICKHFSEKSGFCECKLDYSGERCEENNICKRLDSACERFKAVCRNNNGIPVCQCPPEKKYKWQSGICENICDFNTCIHGKCEIYGSDFKCRCDDGYTGTHCDIKVTPVEYF